MRLTLQELAREAASTGYRDEILEKVIRLLEILDTLRMHPFLKPRLALKGGTALNLFVLDVPRLSVDIDLNYIGAPDRETMVAERPKVDQAVQAVCGRLGIQVKRVPSDHAGGKWRLSYTGVTGRSGTLELDVNYLLRTPLWPPSILGSLQVGSSSVSGVQVLDVHELVAGKLAALFGRTASRDLFDVRELLRRGDLDPAKLRLGFVVYGGINRRDWREVTVDDLRAEPVEVDRLLVPVLRKDLAPKRGELDAWAGQLTDECKDLLSVVLPLNRRERQFLDRLNDHGDVAPELLTDEPEQQSLLQQHPGLLWKALKVQEHRR